MLVPLACLSDECTVPPLDTHTAGCYNPAGNCTGFDYGTDNGRKGIVLRWALANHAKVDVGFNNLVQVWPLTAYGGSRPGDATQGYDMLSGWLK